MVQTTSTPPLPHAITPLVQRHAQDAAFYWQQIDGSTAEPGLGAQRALHFARLLAAHLEGLAAAGSEGVRACQESLQRWRKPGEAFAAAYVALCSDDEAASSAVLDTVARVPDLLLRGLIGALAAAPQAAAQRFFDTAWAQADGHSTADVVRLVAVLRARALRGMAIDAAVRDSAWAHTHPAVRAAACRASQDTAAIHGRLHALLQDPDSAVRAEAAIVLGRAEPPAAMAVLRACVVQKVQASREVTGWNRLQAHRRLSRWLRHLAHLTPVGHPDVPALLTHLPLRQALHFVLCHGDAAHLPFVLRALDHTDQARWAGFVWQSLSGIDLVEAGLALPEPPIALDAALSRTRQDGDQGLPLPDAAAIAAHPAQGLLAAYAGQRLLWGQPCTRERLATLLRIESDRPQLLRAAAAQAWNAQGLSPRIQLRASAAALLRQDAVLQDT